MIVLCFLSYIFPIRSQNPLRPQSGHFITHRLFSCIRADNSYQCGDISAPHFGHLNFRCVRLYITAKHTTKRMNIRKHIIIGIPIRAGKNILLYSLFSTQWNSTWQDAKTSGIIKVIKQKYIFFIFSPFRHS